MKQRNFSRAFKLQAVEAVLTSNLKVAPYAEKLGIDRRIVYRWIDEYKTLGKDGAFGGRDYSSPLQRRIKELEKKLAQAELENEILKKAAAYFAKENEHD